MKYYWKNLINKSLPKALDARHFVLDRAICFCQVYEKFADTSIQNRQEVRVDLREDDQNLLTSDTTLTNDDVIIVQHEETCA